MGLSIMRSAACTPQNDRRSLFDAVAATSKIFAAASGQIGKLR
jgi:hypothetical protein